MNNVSIGMNRLSIIDSKNILFHILIMKKIWAVFNGEIYNFNNKEYKIKNNFRTNSDIEIIIYLYKKYGNKFVNKLNGMFTIAIFDKKINKLLLFRDRAGEKPIFYYFNNREFIFASEIKCLLILLMLK